MDDESINEYKEVGKFASGLALENSPIRPVI